MKIYPDDLSDDEWAIVEPLLKTKHWNRGPKPIYSKRSMLNAIFYVCRTGCGWRHLPKDYASRHGCNLEIVSRRSPKSFVVQAKRWIVERTFAWLGRFRRMSKDYEYRVCSSVSMMYLAMTRLLLKRLEPKCLNC
jgi:transposase